MGPDLTGVDDKAFMTHAMDEQIDKMALDNPEDFAAMAWPWPRTRPKAVSLSV
jgi:hypothetical protein